VSRALSPAKILDVIYDDVARKATVVVSDDQVPMAIGRGGQNARLAARLTGLQIGLVSQSQIEAQREEEAGVPDIDLESLTRELGPKLVEKLVKSGKETLQDVMKTSIEELMEIPGIGEKTASKLLQTGAQILDQRASARQRLAREEAAGVAAEPSEDLEPIEVEEDEEKGEESEPIELADEEEDGGADAGSTAIAEPAAPVESPPGAGTEERSDGSEADEETEGGGE
jgi:N utilization substance protein A